MKKIYIIVFILLLGFAASYAQKPVDYTVRVSAIIQKSPAKITLVWPKDANISKLTIYRRTNPDVVFGTGTSLNVADTSYIDNNVTVGTIYEYQIVKILKTGITPGYGYITAGIEAPVTEDRGKMILIYDKNFLPTLKPEIDRLIYDLTADGWGVIAHSVDTGSKVTDIHDLIKTDYNGDKERVKAVFLLGHVPVPYSGAINPDGHPEHLGAWPTDLYYADMKGNWTDEFTIEVSGSYPANHNMTGDGKFDQNNLPAKAVLEIGRVDMYDMPAFAPLTEIDLIKRYLNKDHNWRIGQVPMNQRGFISDHFGVVAEGNAGNESFAGCGYKNFSAMFGANNIVDAGVWDTVLSKSSYLWSYGTGPGDFGGAGGISRTTDFAKDSLQTVFTMLFGSWFGDWNVQNNYLRAPLASKGPILTNCWAGRPEWLFHHMALGANIGYSALLNFNQYARGSQEYSHYFRSVIYDSNQRAVSVNLMGDPSLRMHVVKPASNLTLSNNKLVVTLNWTASPETGIAGYYVYRSPAMDAPFVRVSPNLVSGTTFTDNSALHHKNFYMVRAVKLQTSASGSYFNMSQGTLDTLTTDNSGIAEEPAMSQMNVYPNPSHNTFHILWPGSMEADGTLRVYDILGNEVLNKSLANLDNLQTINLDMLKASKGIYMVRITNGNQVYYNRIVKD